MSPGRKVHVEGPRAALYGWNHKERHSGAGVEKVHVTRALHSTLNTHREGPRRTHRLVLYSEETRSAAGWGSTRKLCYQLPGSDHRAVGPSNGGSQQLRLRPHQCLNPNRLPEASPPVQLLGLKTFTHRPTTLYINFIVHPQIWGFTLNTQQGVW